MTTELYRSGKIAHMSGLDVVNDDIVALFIDLTEYTYDGDLHGSVADVPDDAIISSFRLTREYLLPW